MMNFDNSLMVLSHPLAQELPKMSWNTETQTLARSSEVMEGLRASAKKSNRTRTTRTTKTTSWATPALEPKAQPTEAHEISLPLRATLHAPLRAPLRRVLTQ